MAPSNPSNLGELAARSSISKREREIVHLVTCGLKNREIAEMLFISQQTVKTHLYSIFNKLGVSDRLELALYPLQSGKLQSRVLVIG